MTNGTPAQSGGERVVSADAGNAAYPLERPTRAAHGGLERKRRPSRGVWWGAVGVALVAAGLRFWQLGVIPPGFQFDEAFNGLDALGILAGRLEMFFPANGGREPLLAYVQSLSLRALGADAVPFALRFVSAFAGILTVAAVVPVMGGILGTRRAGLYAGAFLAVSFWHVHFSRYAIRAILAPLWTALALGAWWAAVHETADRRRAFAAAAASGVLMAVALYSHPTGRLVPVIVAIHWLGRMLSRSAGDRKRDTMAIGTAAVTAVLVSLPLLVHFIRHPSLFTSHPNDVSIQAVAMADHGGSVAAALAGNAASIAGMFLVRGDPSTFHNLPGLPAFDPVTGLLAVLGAGVLGAMLLRGRAADNGDDSGTGGTPRERAAFLLLWAAVMLMPTLLSDRPPNYSRAIAALPALVALPALGTIWAERAISRRGLAGSARAAPAADTSIEPAAGGLASAAKWLAPAAVIWGAAWTLWHLGSFARLDHVDHSYDVHIMDAYSQLAQRAEEADVYLHPLWADHATFSYLNRDGPVRTMDGSASLAVTDRGRPVEIAFPAEQEEAIESAESLFGPAGAVRTEVSDGRGDPLLSVFRTEPALWGDMRAPTDAPLEPQEWLGAEFGSRLRLVGATPRTDQGVPLVLDLWWEALPDVSAETHDASRSDLTTFVHVLDAKGRPVGQVDREPGMASRRTSTWRPGDLMLERYEPLIAPDAIGPLTVQVGWYDAVTGNRLALTRPVGGAPLARAESAATIGPIEWAP